MKIDLLTISDNLPITRLFYILLAVVFFSSCNKNDGNNDSNKILKYEDNVTLINSRLDKSILLDTLTSADKVNVNLYQDIKSNEQRDFLYLLSRLDFSLQKYNWNTGKFISKIKIPKEGPQGVGRVFSLLVSSPDSIFVLAPYEFKVSLISESGKLMKRYNLITSSNKKTSLGNGVLPLSDEGCYIYKDNENLFLCGAPNDDYKLKTFYSDGEVGIKLNLLTGISSYLMKMPHKFTANFNNGYSLSGQQIIFAQTFNKEQNIALVNFPTEDFLYRVNLSNSEIDSVYAGGIRKTEFQYVTKDRIDPKEEFKYFASKNYYPSVFYDQYRNLYYRFMGTPNEARVNLFDRSDDTPIFIYSIIILDKNLKKVGDVKLSKYNTKPKMIIKKEGIYIPKYTVDESKLIYDLYKVKKK